MINVRRISTLVFVSVVALLLIAPSSTGQAAPSPDRYPDFEERKRLPYLAIEHEPAAVSPNHTTGIYPIPWSKIVFQSYRHENWEIYKVNSDGTQQQRLTSNAAADIHPRLNRGGTHIVFASNRHGPYQIYKMSVDGSNVTRLTYATTDNVNPVWSPDGTRIAFQAYRDGQAEIYVMNANGSGQTRLTANSAYDGEPVWSPDGSQIAFVSKRTGGYRIWVMQADGSGLTQVSSEPYSENPSWSPDGKRLAYDADRDGDGWQEIVIRNVDASWSFYLHYDLNNPGKDAWVGSWSPNGKYIIFTHIAFVNYNGYWYWTEARLRAWEVSPYGQMTTLIPETTEWSPDWQSLDAEPPIPLLTVPPESPNPILVHYHGQDSGGSGCMDFDVQYREDGVAEWTDLGVEVPDYFPFTIESTKGETFYFRMRARDYAFNVSEWTPELRTTVESYPPQSYINAFPPYARYSSDGLEVSWSVHDPGGSEITFLEVQYRPEGLDWTPWLTNPTSSSATFYGELGHTYAFRTRAVDRAQNEEQWPEGDGDTQTTLCSWGITGQVMDNTGIPVSGAVVSTTPESATEFSSSASGEYGAYVIQPADWYTATITKPGYGSVPSTTFPLAEDAKVDFALPPIDNIVRDWGFEEGNLNDGNWASHSITDSTNAPYSIESPPDPILITSTIHTGRYALQFGKLHRGVLTPVHLHDNLTRSCMSIATDGIVHAVGVLYDAFTDIDTMYYASRDLTGAWSIPEVITTSQPYKMFGYNCDVDSEGRFHIVLTTNGKMYYAQRYVGGSWAQLENVDGDFRIIQGYGINIDNLGRVHIIRLVRDNTNSVNILEYVQRNPDGSWSAPYYVSNASYSVGDAQVKVDADGNLYCAWRYPEDNTLRYRSRNATQGTWSPTTVVTPYAENFEMVIGHDGATVHMFWMTLTDGFRLYYARKVGELSFSTPVQLAVNEFPEEYTEHNGTAYTYWVTNNEIYFRTVNEQGFSAPQFLGAGGDQVKSSVDANGILHLAWLNGDDLYYAFWESGQGPSTPRIISINSRFSEWNAELKDFIAEDIGHLHFSWSLYEGLYYLEVVQPLQIPPSHAISQRISVPSTLTHPTLSFFYQLGGIRTEGDAWLAVEVENNESTTTVFTATQNTSTWQHQSVDMRKWLGQSITLTFSLHHESIISAYAYLDEISLGSARPDVWINGARSEMPPGADVVYLIYYGNQGGGTASAVRITNTLPSEMTFVSASIPPATTDPVLTWNVGTLPPQSGPHKIFVRATLASTTPVYSTLTHTLEIAPQNIGISGTLLIDLGLVELETANNRAVATVFAGKHVYLPIVLKGHQD